jgi:cobyric acid synthase
VEQGAHPEEHERSFKERQYDLLAEHFEKYLDMPKLLKIAGITEQVERHTDD